MLLRIIKYYFSASVLYLLEGIKIRILLSFLNALLGKYRTYCLLSHLGAWHLKAVPMGNHNISCKKCVCIMFDGRIHQAGLADNLRGMVAIYNICKEKDVDFKIFYNYPFELLDFLIPNEYNWQLLDNQKIYSKNEAVDVVCMSKGYLFGKINAMLQERYIFHKLFDSKATLIRLYSNIQYMGNNYSRDFLHLFKPSALLQNEIEKQQLLIGGKYVSASFRFANLLGDIQDTYGIELKKSQKVELIESCKKAIVKIFNNNNVDKVLVTSDSNSFISELSEMDFVYVIPGKPGHLGYNGDYEVVLKTFLDMYMIALAEKVYMVRTEQMYKSGFAKNASFIYNKPFEEYFIEE